VRTRLVPALAAAALILCAATAGAVPLHDFPRELSLCGERVPLERQDVWEMMDQTFISSVYNVPQVILWIKRAHRYFPYVEKRLRQRKMPDDLKYVVVVESSLRTYALSSAKAVGPWQFMEGTAKKYGLRVDKWIDERLNFERSTEAALDYLKDLHDLFQSWTLAMAAYNCGENRLGKSRDHQGSRSFYDTDLPLETEAYIFRILSAKVILSRPEAYGYSVPVERRYRPFVHDEVEVRLPAEVPVKTLARAAGTTFKEIKEMNPEIRQDSLPAGRFRIRVPQGKGKQFKDNLSSFLR